jgi:hypothetical protein
MNKKSQLYQIVFIIVVIVGFGITVLIANKVLNEFWTAIGTSGMNNSYTAQLERDFASVPATLDYSLIFIIVGLTIGLVVSSFMIPSHPIFIIINIFGIFFLVFLSMTLSNLYGELVAGASSPFMAEAENFPITIFAIQYLPYICIFIVFISTVVMFAKGQGGGV